MAQNKNNQLRKKNYSTNKNHNHVSAQLANSSAKKNSEEHATNNRNQNNNVSNNANHHTTNHTTTQTNTATNTHTQSIPQKNQQHEVSERHEYYKPTPRHHDNKVNWIAALCIIGGTIVVGIIATLLGGKMNEAYIPPPAYPPEWVFPVAWSIFYIAIGVAMFLSYVTIKDKQTRLINILIYSMHLFFNLLWTLFYFRLDLLIFSCIWLALVVISAIVVTYRFYKEHIVSGIIFTIYTLWLLYAMYLNLAITIINA